MNCEKQKKKKKNIAAISTNSLTKDLINKFIILDGAKYFWLGIFQNYLAFIPDKNKLKILVALLELIHKNLMECQKKVLEI